MLANGIRYALGGLIALMIVVAPWMYWSHRRDETRNFRVVREGVLYRSGQMSQRGFKRMVREHGLRTVVTFRASREKGQPHPDQAEEDYCKKFGVNYFRIGTNGAWSTGKGPDSMTNRVGRFLKIVGNPKNHPVLVHCMAGVHRTGAYCAVYRMEFENWPAFDAIDEMKALGYDSIERHFDLHQYLLDYPQSSGRRRQNKKELDTMNQRAAN